MLQKPINRDSGSDPSHRYIDMCSCFKQLNKPLH